MKIIFLLTILSIILFSCSTHKVANMNKPINPVSQINADLYVVLDTAFGNLNMDLITDKIIIYKSLEESANSESKRPLEIYLGQADGTFLFAESNENVVLCYACGGVFGDPYEDVIIENGSFTVSHYGGSNWRWTRAITFSFVKDYNTWLLTDDSGISYNVNEEEKTNETLIHNPEDFGMIKFKDFDNEKGM